MFDFLHKEEAHKRIINKFAKSPEKVTDREIALVLSQVTESPSDPIIQYLKERNCAKEFVQYADGLQEKIGLLRFCSYNVEMFAAFLNATRNVTDESWPDELYQKLRRFNSNIYDAQLSTGPLSKKDKEELHTSLIDAFLCVYNVCNAQSKNNSTN